MINQITKNEIFDFAKSVIEKSVPDESEYINEFATLRIKKAFYTLMITKRKKATYIEDIAMFVPVEKPDTPLAAVELMFNQCFFEGLKTLNGITRIFEIVLRKRMYSIHVQVAPRHFDEPFWDIDESLHCTKKDKDKNMERVIHLIKKSGESGISKSELTTLIKNYSPDIREYIKMGIDNSSFIVKDLRPIEDSRKKSVFYIYLDPVEVEDDADNE